MIQIAPDSTAAERGHRPACGERLAKSAGDGAGEKSIVTEIVRAGCQQDGKTVTRAIDLPPRDGEQELSSSIFRRWDDTIEAKIIAGDDLHADNIAWLVSTADLAEDRAANGIAGGAATNDRGVSEEPPAADHRAHLIVADSSLSIWRSGVVIPGEAHPRSRQAAGER